MKDLILDKVKDEKVSLYYREFLGINKECDDKTNISQEMYDNLKQNQNYEKILLLIEAIILYAFLLPSYILFFFEMLS